MNKFLSNKYLLLLFRLILALIFIYAGIIKIANPSDFSQSIANYKILPGISINFFAITLPWIEFISGLLLLFGIAVKENAAILTSLLAVFVIAIAISLARGLNIECGCFGTSTGSTIGFTKLLENIGLIITGLILMKYDSDFMAINKSSQFTNTH